MRAYLKAAAFALICFIAPLLLFGADAIAQSGGQTTRPTWFDGSTQYYVSTAHPLPVSASVSATVTGFASATTGTPISVTTGGVTGTLPAGAVVVASNVGATNGAYCKLGASATTADQLIPPNSWFAFTVGVSTQLTCITSTSTTTVNMVGGAGLPTGAGGGGGGSGGGGAVTIASGAVASGAYSAGSLAAGAGVDGWDLTQGAKADSAWVSGSGSVVAILKNIAGGVGSAIPAGTATIGNVVNAPTSSSSLALTGVSCGSAVSSCVLKASAGNFYGAYADCTSACWLMVFNATSAPSNGSTTAGIASGNLVECIDISAGSSKSLNYPTIPVAYSVGITAAISSTACATLTLSTVGFVRGTVQ